MGSFWNKTIAVIVGCLLAAGLVAAENAADPRTTVLSMLDAVRTLSKLQEGQTDSRLVRRISDNFHLAGISQSCLRDTWEKLSEQERKAFMELFRDVLEKVAYPKSSKFFKDTQVEVEEVSQTGDKAEVTTLVLHPEEGEVEVSYCLHRVEGKWLIEDILLDGVSLVVDLRSQMQKILREESYEELKRRLREKLNE